MRNAWGQFMQGACEHKPGATSGASIRRRPEPSGALSVCVSGLRVTISFPEPTSSLNALHGSHWSKIVRERQKWRQYAKLAVYEARSAGWAPMQRATGDRRSKVVLMRYGARLLDGDNLAASGKATLDALVRTGFLVDDSPKYCTVRYEQRIGMPRRTVVVIEPEVADQHENGDGV